MSAERPARVENVHISPCRCRTSPSSRARAATRPTRWAASRFHFDGPPSVLVRASRLGEISRQELAELVRDAWLAQAAPRRRAAWLAENGPAARDPADS